MYTSSDIKQLFDACKMNLQVLSIITEGNSTGDSAHAQRSVVELSELEKLFQKLMNIRLQLLIVEQIRCEEQSNLRERLGQFQETIKQRRQMLVDKQQLLQKLFNISIRPHGQTLEQHKTAKNLKMKRWDTKNTQRVLQEAKAVRMIDCDLVQQINRLKLYQKQLESRLVWESQYGQQWRKERKRKNKQNQLKAFLDSLGPSCTNYDQRKETSHVNIVLTLISQEDIIIEQKSQACSLHKIANNESMETSLFTTQQRSTNNNVNQIHRQQLMQSHRERIRKLVDKPENDIRSLSCEVNLSLSYSNNEIALLQKPDKSGFSDQRISLIQESKLARANSNQDSESHEIYSFSSSQEAIDLQQSKIKPVFRQNRLHQRRGKSQPTQREEPYGANSRAQIKLQLLKPLKNIKQQIPQPCQLPLASYLPFNPIPLLSLREAGKQLKATEAHNYLTTQSDVTQSTLNGAHRDILSAQNVSQNFDEWNEEAELNKYLVWERKRLINEYMSQEQLIVSLRSDSHKFDWLKLKK